MERQTKTTKSQLRQPRVFSATIRKQVVNDIESGKCSVSQAQAELGVSRQSVYKWIHRYSRHLSKNRVMVVEDNSEAYRSRELEKKIKDLEAALGRKQMELDYINKLMELAGKDLGIDLKKNTAMPPWNGTEPPKDDNTDTK